MTATGVKPDQNKIKGVANWPHPQTAFEVSVFFGLAHYFRKHEKAGNLLICAAVDWPWPLKPQ
jgi:hypothetical protein